MSKKNSERIFFLSYITGHIRSSIIKNSYLNDWLACNIIKIINLKKADLYEGHSCDSTSISSNQIKFWLQVALSGARSRGAERRNYCGSLVLWWGHLWVLLLLVSGYWYSGGGTCGYCSYWWVGIGTLAGAPVGIALIGEWACRVCYEGSGNFSNCDHDRFRLFQDQLWSGSIKSIKDYVFLSLICSVEIICSLFYIQALPFKWNNN